MPALRAVRGDPLATDSKEGQTGRCQERRVLLLEGPLGNVRTAWDSNPLWTVSLAKSDGL